MHLSLLLVVARTASGSEESTAGDQDVAGTPHTALTGLQETKVATRQNNVRTAVTR